MKKYIIAVLLVGLFSACNSWLDETPKTRVDSESLLTTSEGYNKALAGCYYLLSQDMLYGKNLEYEMMDAMAQYWEINTSHDMFEFAAFNYTNMKVETRLAKIWSGMYEVIFNTNHILASLEETDMAKLGGSELIKGEALAIRAFTHIEVLKMYGPVLVDGGLDKAAIPYRTKYDNVAIKFSTARETLTKAIEDLTEAKKLLANDPIKELGRTGDGNIHGQLNYNGLYDWRGARMNTYAVDATLMRAYILLGDKAKAYEYANALITELEESKIIRFTSTQEIATPPTLNHRDIRFSPEMIFSLYKNDLYIAAGPIFGYTDYSIENSTIQRVKNDMRVALYTETQDGSTDDYRFKYWFESASQNMTFNKYVKDPVFTNLTFRTYHPEVCMIRLPEIYYTAAETFIGTNNAKALELLSKVRVTRGLPELDIQDYSNDDLVWEALMNEQRKEFFGEGKMFGLYKRWFREVSIPGRTTVIKKEKTIYVFPIPDAEYEYSPNEKE